LKGRRGYFAVGLSGAALLAAGTIAFAGKLRTTATVTPIAVEERQIASFNFADPARTRFGTLESRGGLALTSSERGSPCGYRRRRDGATARAR
jgi:hypothetical protein